MKASTAKEELLDKGLQIDHEQFEQLCKMVIERAEPTRELELTPFRGDGGIDIHAVIDRELFHARLGVQAKQYATVDILPGLKREDSRGTAPLGWNVYGL